VCCRASSVDPLAREVPEAGCAIDFQPRAFGPGSCAQTLLARVGINAMAGRRRALSAPSPPVVRVVAGEMVEDAGVGVGGELRLALRLTAKQLLYR
jgi:hypothetical protein